MGWRDNIFYIIAIMNQYIRQVQHKKGFINIILIISIIIIAATAGYFVLTINTPITDQDFGTQVSQEYLDVQSASDNQITMFELQMPMERCVEGGNNITDKNHPLVLEARQALISNSKMSESYFKKHFSLYCANSDHPMPTYSNHVVFTYKIGDYVTKISDSVDDRGRFYGFKNNFKDLHEIENVISKRSALLNMQTCIGGINYPFIILKQEKNEIGLYLEAIFGSSPLVLRGRINLETGMCSKESLPYIR